MKKFISLVMALVMALSLTTVAWGANTIYVSTTGNDSTGDGSSANPYATFLKAASVAAEGDTIMLAAGNHGDLGTLGTVAKNLSIVGADGAIATYLGFGAKDYGTVTIKNIDFEDDAVVWCSICIEGKGDFTIEDCTFTTASDGSAIYLSDSFADSQKLTVKKCAFDSVYGEAAIVVQNAKTTDACVVSVSENDFTEVEGESVGVWYKDSTVDLTSDVAEVTMVRSAAELEAAIAAADAGDTIKLMGGDVDVTNTVAITKPITIDTNGKTLTGLTAGAGVTTDASGKVTSGTFTSVPANVADGYTVTKTTAGTYVVTAATLLGEKFDLYLANAQLNANLKAGVATVSGVKLTEVPANTFTNGSGNVAYIKGNNGEYYVKTTTPYTTSYAVTAADKTTVLYYVDAAGNDAGAFTYTAKATEFKNFSLTPKCGYVTGKPAAGATYFQLADGTVYLAADASATEANNYLVGDTVYSKGAPQAVVAHYFKANNYKYDATVGNIPTSAICTTCLTTSTAIYKDALVPAGTFAYELNGDTAYAVVVGSPFAPVVTPSTDVKVESAETFDAGIAMYVGMSVMAAAGSAVVLKKKD